MKKQAILTLMSLILIVAGSAPAQEPGTLPVVALGDVEALSGRTALVPLSLTNAEGEEVVLGRASHGGCEYEDEGRDAVHG